MYPSVLPCGMCGQHFAEVLKEHPFPDSRDPKILFEWSVHAHNLVNARVGKPILTVEQALNAWAYDVRPPPKTSFDIKNVVIAVLVLLLIFMFYIK